MSYQLEIENAKLNLAECQRKLHKHNRTTRQIAHYSALIQHWTEIILFNRWRLIYL